MRARNDLLFLGMGLCEQGHLQLAAGQSASAKLAEAEEMVRQTGVGPLTDLGRALGRLERAQRDFEAKLPLFRGERLEDVPEGVVRYLQEIGQLSLG